jgi:hypothetical protein
MGAFAYRLAGAALLDASVYEGIETDPAATWQAAATVVLSSLAAGLGLSGLADFRLATFALMSAIACATWIAWAMLTLQIGTRMLPESGTKADLGQLLRTIGFAAAPGLLQVFAVLPKMMLPIFIGTAVWMLAAMVVAVRQALDFRSLGRALAVCGMGAGLSIALAIIIGLLFGPTAS